MSLVNILFDIVILCSFLTALLPFHFLKLSAVITGNRFFQNPATFFLIAFLLSLSAIHPYHNWGDDFSGYLAQAAAIVNSNIKEWYLNNTWIISHSHYGIGPNAYPWGCPLLFAPIYKCFGLNPIPYKLLEIAFYSLSVVLLFYIYKSCISSCSGIVLLFFICLNRQYFNFTNDILSDLPSLFFTSLAFLVMKEYFEKRTIIYGVVVGAILAFNYEIRSSSMPLIISFVLCDVYYNIFRDKRKRDNIKANFKINTLVPYGTLITIYLIFALLFPAGTSSYEEMFTFNVFIIFQNAVSYLKIFTELFIGTAQFDGSLGFLILTIVLTTLTLIGLINHGKNVKPLAFYIIFSYLMLCLFNGYRGMRYIYAVFPFSMVFTYYGTKDVLLKFQGFSNALVSISILSICCSLGLYSVLTVKKIMGDESYKAGPYTNDSIEMFDFIRTNVNSDSIVYFFCPRAFHLFSKGVLSYVDVDDENSLKDADYVLLSDDDEFYLLHDAVKNSDHYSIVFSNDSLQLYRIIDDGEK